MGEVLIDCLLALVIAVSLLFDPLAKKRSGAGLTKKQRKVMKRICISASMALVLQLLPAALFDNVFGFLGRWVRLGLYAAAYWIIGGDILKKAWKGIRNRQVFDENFLMAIATVGAMAIAIWTNGDYLEAVAVMLFYQLGELFQSYAVGASRRNIASLMDIRPDYANVEQDGKLIRVDPDTVSVDSIIVVQPGERVPLDGIVVEGNSVLNTVALTGESLPRDVETGDEIISGCVNMTGVLKIRTTKPFGESTVSRILELVENASSRKSRSEDFIAKFARYYTPAVCISALVLAVLPPMVRLVLGLAPEFGSWLYRGLTFLVISCPCALVISIPLTFFAGIGGASHAGILIKGSNYLETVAKTKIVVFDKTGTLTHGSFEVESVHHNAMEDAAVIEYAALAEAASSHPISKSLREAYGKEIDRSRVQNIQEIGGHGVLATVDGIPVAVGNEKLMKQQGIAYIPCTHAGTLVHVAVNGKYEGHILISDQVKATAREAVAQLKKCGVQKVVMLTGDADAIAQRIGNELGMDEIHSQLLPGDKVDLVEQLLNQKEAGQTLAFVGDGINDAPVLGRADVGIAMGAMGSDAAIEAADMVLMDDDPRKVVQAIRIARKCISIVYQNIVFALAIKFACLILGAFGKANMWFAIFADVGVMVLAVLNAIRALKIKKME